jgi:hypothetical protein
VTAKKHQDILANIIAEAITIQTVEALNGTLALRRLHEAGLQISKRFGDIRVVPRTISEAFMYADAASLGYDIDYAPGPQRDPGDETDAVGGSTASADWTPFTAGVSALPSSFWIKAAEGTESAVNEQGGGRHA